MLTRNRRSLWDAKQAKTDLFAQELKDEAGALRGLEADIQAQISKLLQTLQAEIVKLPKPESSLPIPELLPTTQPSEAREVRYTERKDWKRADKVRKGQLWEYEIAVSKLVKAFMAENSFKLVWLAARYLWLKDVHDKPLYEVSGTAFYGIVGYWLRENDRVVKRGYWFNSEAEERAVMRELYRRQDEWQPEGCRVGEVLK